MGKVMIIATPSTHSYADYYAVNLETGDITNSNATDPQKRKFSGGWKFIGFVSVRSIGRVAISLDDIRNDPKILESIEFEYKNGNPRYSVRDIDHGTVRVWGNTQHHGVRYAYIEK